MNNTTGYARNQDGVDQPMIQAIEVNYKGIRFRSKLEARHAMLLDEFGIIWEYEPHYLKAGGQSYLPDFLLPEIKTYLEVKGDTVPGRERAIEVMTECWKVGVVSQETRFVISNGYKLESLSLGYMEDVIEDNTCYMSSKFTPYPNGLYSTGAVLAKCKSCKKVYFSEDAYGIWSCPACGRSGDFLEVLQGENKGSSPGEQWDSCIELPQIRTDWK